MPKSPFSNRSLEEWMTQLQQAASAEDRYRALLAITSSGSPQQCLGCCTLALNDQDSGVRALAAKQLRELKSRNAVGMGESPDTWVEIATKLQTLLTDEDPDVRFEAARALTHVNPDVASARHVLLDFLDDEGTQPLMLAVVVTAIGERRDLGVAELQPRFQKLLGHAQAEVRENASAVVCQWGADVETMIPELIVALDDDEPIVRENAAVALFHCRTATVEVLAALRTASTDEDEGVAAAAAKSLHKLLGSP
jgi:HEAT repeat protein